MLKFRSQDFSKMRRNYPHSISYDRAARFSWVAARQKLLLIYYEFLALLLGVKLFIGYGVNIGEFLIISAPVYLPNHKQERFRRRVVLEAKVYLFTSTKLHFFGLGINLDTVGRVTYYFNITIHIVHIN